MPDDRFEDLGRGTRSAAERLEEEDRLRPEPDLPPSRPDVPRPGNKYAWLVGFLMLMAIGVLLATTALPNRGHGVLGLERGERLPEFAAPLITSELVGDANVRPASGGSDQQGRLPACSLTSEDVVNLCELRRKPLVLSFIFDESANCNPHVDLVERVRPNFPQVSFATVFFTREEDRRELKALAARRRWSMPIGIDRDGQVTNAYGVGVCPTTVFAFRGGVASETRLKAMTEGQLRSKLRQLLRQQRARDARADG
jgi:AhpC/TSA family